MMQMKQHPASGESRNPSPTNHDAFTQDSPQILLCAFMSELFSFYKTHQPLSPRKREGNVHLLMDEKIVATR